MNTRLGQPVRSVVVGIRGFPLNVRAFSVLHELSTLYVPTCIPAYLFSNAAMDVGNRAFTFGLSHVGFMDTYVRYVLVGAVAAGLVEGLRLDPRSAQSLALTLLVPLSFLLSTRVAFRLSPDAPREFPYSLGPRISGFAPSEDHANPEVKEIENLEHSAHGNLAPELLSTICRWLSVGRL